MTAGGTTTGRQAAEQPAGPGPLPARIPQRTPRAAAVAGLATAVALLVGIDISRWAELLFPAWVLALSIGILVAGPRSATRPITPGG